MVEYIVVNRNGEPELDFDTESEAKEFAQLNERHGFHVTTVLTDEATIPDKGIEEDRYAYERDEGVQQMAEKILKFVEGYQPTSYAELIRHLGKDAEGDLQFQFSENPNLVIWMGVSSLDGQMLTLPVATRLDHKKPHWVPTALHIRTPEHDVILEEAKRKREQREKRKAAKAAKAAV